MYETLQRTGHLDPADLLRLPEEVVVMHLAHTRSHFIGRYEPAAPGMATGSRKRSAPPKPADLERWRSRDRSADVKAARELLARDDLPPHLRRSAEATLRAAGAL